MQDVLGGLVGVFQTRTTDGVMKLQARQARVRHSRMIEATEAGFGD